MNDLCEGVEAPSKLSRANKRRAILQALAEDPSRSDREIARLVGVGHQLVAAVRNSSNPGTLGELKSPTPSKSSSNSPTRAPVDELPGPKSSTPDRIPHPVTAGEIQTPHPQASGENAQADPLTVILGLIPALDWGGLVRVIEAACPDDRQRPRLREPDWRELVESGDGYAWWLLTAPLNRMRDPDERALRKRATHALAVSRRADQG